MIPLMLDLSVNRSISQLVIMPEALFDFRSVPPHTYQIRTSCQHYIHARDDKSLPLGRHKQLEDCESIGYHHSDKPI